MTPHARRLLARYRIGLWTGIHTPRHDEWYPDMGQCECGTGFVHVFAPRGPGGGGRRKSRRRRSRPGW